MLEEQVVDLNSYVTGFLLGTPGSDMWDTLERVLPALLKSGHHRPFLDGEFLIAMELRTRNLAIQGLIPFGTKKGGWVQQGRAADELLEKEEKGNLLLEGGGPSPGQMTRTTLHKTRIHYPFSPPGLTVFWANMQYA